MKHLGAHTIPGNLPSFVSINMTDDCQFVDITVRGAHTPFPDHLIPTKVPLAERAMWRTTGPVGVHRMTLQEFGRMCGDIERAMRARGV